MPKVNKDKHIELLDKKWKQLIGPKSIVIAILISIPIMILTTFITILLINIVSTISFKEFGINKNSIKISINVIGIASVFFMVIIHELIHLIFIPNFKKSDKIVIGFSLFGGYVYSEEVIAKSRYILISITPYIIISIISPLVLGVLGLLNPIIKFLILVNAIASSVDILNFLLILFQVPSDAYLTSNGMTTYWKNA
ncbi:MAG: DUF3267 domain-containing protein [Firmicutes bacterium]|nr:DUF3267 domain-containing protein [Bacillota bacterium]